MKIIYIDTETGGPDPNVCALLQLSAAIEIDWKVTEKLNYFIKPYPSDPPITEEAIAKHGITAKYIEQNQNNKFKDPSEVFTDLKTKLGQYVDPYDKNDKFFTVGYNIISYDDVVLRRFFKNNNDTYYGSWFWYPPLDMMAICADVLLSKRIEMPNFQLATVAQAMGIKIEENQLHDALYDVKVTREMFLRHLSNKNIVYSIYKKYKDQYIADQKSETT